MVKKEYYRQASKYKLVGIFFIISCVIFFISYNIEALIVGPQWLTLNSNASQSIYQDWLEPEVWYIISGTDTTTRRYIFTSSQIKEKCWRCHADIYPDVPVFADPEKKIDVRGFASPTNLEHSYPLFYSPLDNYQKDNKKRLGHRSHVVRQPFGVGRNCLDCHSSYYKSQEHENQTQANKFVYFRKSNNNDEGMVSLSITNICTECHGGYYPKERDPKTVSTIPDPSHPEKKIDPTDVTTLEWGNPATVECLHCHDDSPENGGIYASYVSRYSNNTGSNWRYADATYGEDNGELRIFSPDPDKVPGYNYWTKNGHGLYTSQRYPGAVLDSGYPSQDSPGTANYPNKGAMKEDNLIKHDINLDENDGGLNFCWECHWSNSMALTTITNHLNTDFSIGKYNGHLDTIKRDERWGNPAEFTLAPHYQVETCRKCHENKYSHYAYPGLTPYSSGILTRPFTTESSLFSDLLERLYIIAPNGGLDEEKPLYYCIACHNPHGSGTYNGKSNLFMIKGQIYKNHCKNCHYSQHAEHFSPGADAQSQTTKAHRKPVIFLDAFQQDGVSSEHECGTCHEIPDAPTQKELHYHTEESPVETSDICETCHRGIPAPTTLYQQKNPSHNGEDHIWKNEKGKEEKVDYRGSDCTACHMHDPWPLPHDDINRRAFAPTCRCHDKNDYNRYNPTNKYGDISYGKGHAVPPGQYPGIYPADFEDDYAHYTEDHPDPHTLHARYNFPCQRCHTDPDLLTDSDPANDIWIPLDLDGSKTMGFDTMNPGASYNINEQKCSNLYCHGNGQESGGDVWWEAGPFRLTAESTDSCNKCHLYPPDGSHNSTAHPKEATQCDTCHPHNGNWTATPQFYKHVNGTVDFADMGLAWRDGAGATDCGGCHNYGVIDSSHYPKGFNDIKEVHMKVFSDNVECTICHINVHQDSAPSLFYKDSSMATKAVDALCKACHIVGDNYTHLEALFKGPLDTSMKDIVKSMQPEHLAQNQGANAQLGCLGCHNGISLVKGHYKEDPLTQSMKKAWAPLSNSCGTCHKDPYVNGLSTHLHGNVDNNCSVCHGSHRQGDYWNYCEDTPDARGVITKEDKCKDCHATISIESSHIPNNHVVNENCLSCHPGVCQENSSEKYRTNASQVIPRKHYLGDENSFLTIGPGGMEPVWRDEATGTHCGVCHNVARITPTIIKSIHVTDLKNEECEECHFNFHSDAPASIFYKQGTPALDNAEIDRLCTLCHSLNDLLNSSGGKYPHNATSNCFSCHQGFQSLGNIKHYNAPPRSSAMYMEPSWAVTAPNSCGRCHADTVISRHDGNLTIHATIPPTIPCSECHGYHNDMNYFDTSFKCTICHGTNPIIHSVDGIPGPLDHLSYDGTPANMQAIQDCLSCHSNIIDGGETNRFLHMDQNIFVKEGACLGCHSLLAVRHGQTDVMGCYQCHMGEHGNTVYNNSQACIWCHTDNPPIMDICGKDPSVTTSHLSMEGAMQNQIAISDCMACHYEPNLGGEANPLEHRPEEYPQTHTYVNNSACLGCHTVSRVPHGTSGLPFGGNVWPQVDCYLCHPDHCETVYTQNEACIWCHTDNPPIRDICGKNPGMVTTHLSMESSFQNKIAISNCLGCHHEPGQGGEANPYQHMDDPITYVNTNACFGCHTVSRVPHGTSGLPFAGGIWPQVDCYQCHPKHCETVYTRGDACIWCHSDNPPIRDICGKNPGVVTTHLSMEGSFQNKIAISDCLSCHHEPGQGGEANPYQHMDDPITYVNTNACFGCHTVSRVPHGTSGLPFRGGVWPQVDCYQCHPRHCETIYNQDDACIWCHSPDPPVRDICGQNRGITKHTLFESTPVNQLQITKCTGCHVEPTAGGEANPMNHIDDPITYVNPGTCFGCHTVGLVPHGQSGLPFEGGIWPQVNCYSCHPNHCETIYGRNDACIWCHTPNPPIVDICGQGPLTPQEISSGQRRDIVTGHLIFNESTLENQIAITDCIRCHMEPLLGGEANPLNHINDPITYVNNNACFGCHPRELKIKHGFDPSSPFKGKVWPQVDCYSCHPNHCRTDFCANDSCYWCHSMTPPLRISVGNNVVYDAAHIGNSTDCIDCHVTGGPNGGECNPTNHGNEISYVREGTCGICHTDLLQTHGPQTQDCKLCHPGPEHISADYCMDPKCMACHPPEYIKQQNPSLPPTAFPIISDYGCGSGVHNEAAYKECSRCHMGECNPFNHDISPQGIVPPTASMTDVSGMQLNWVDCGLCHADAQHMHGNCQQPECTLCHSGTSKHACIELNYCQGNQCKCCHVFGNNPIPEFPRLDLSPASPIEFPHTIEAYNSDCAGCHGGECNSLLHLDRAVDVSNMQFGWASCGLCHVNEQAIHANCTTGSCNDCHVGATNHLKGLSYCNGTQCRCCHLFGNNTAPQFPRLDLSPTSPIEYPHTVAAYESDCAACHIGECDPPIHLDTAVDVSNMQIGWGSCGLCHVDEQVIHTNCALPCGDCHLGTTNHLKGYDYCGDFQCRCCHQNNNVPATHLFLSAATSCDCSTCHLPACDPSQHDPSGTATLHPLDPLYYNYTGTGPDTGCDCCHGYPPQAKCVGISTTQDHCLDSVAGCAPQIYDCAPCHTLFNGLPNHIYTPYTTDAIISSCACHGSANLATSGAHNKHFTTQVMPTVYPGSSNVIDCGVCHQPGITLASTHVICLPGQATGAPVDFDETLPFIGAGDIYVPGATPGTGSCQLYCHSDGDEDPSATGIYTYLSGVPPLWNQLTGIISCGNVLIGQTPDAIFQCHGYPPPSHPPGHRLCSNCHPTPLVGTVPDNSLHINGNLEITIGGPGGAGPIAVPII